jgi:hypothetical protein
VAFFDGDDGKFLTQFPNFANLSVPHMPAKMVKCPGIPGTHTGINPQGVNRKGGTTEDVRNPT